MIILTGGAGFIGTNTLIQLNEEKIDDISFSNNERYGAFTEVIFI